MSADGNGVYVPTGYAKERDPGSQLGIRGRYLGLDQCFRGVSVSLPVRCSLYCHVRGSPKNTTITCTFCLEERTSEERVDRVGLRGRLGTKPQVEIPGR